MRLLLDSSFVIDHMRGVAEAIDRYRVLFEAGDEPVVNDIVVCEVRAGANPADLSKLHAFLEPVEFVQPGPGTALVAGAWRYQARQRGLHLSLPDSLVAAAAHAVDAAVLTRNVRHFALTPVRVETY
jgi:predicted nucleic acid-binding protein